MWWAANVVKRESAGAAEKNKKVIRANDSEQGKVDFCKVAAEGSARAGPRPQICKNVPSPASYS